MRLKSKRCRACTGDSSHESSHELSRTPIYSRLIKGSNPATSMLEEARTARAFCLESLIYLRFSSLEYCTVVQDFGLEYSDLYTRVHTKVHTISQKILIQLIVDAGGFILHEMLINLFEHVRSAVAHALHGVFIRDAQGKQDGCVIVAQGMEAVVQAE